MIIFDFDQTLVDTSPVEALRAARRWRDVMARASDLKVYDGIGELLDVLHQRGQTLAIVTKSPDMVPKAFIRAHKWPIDIVVGYHHVKKRKPDPEGLLLAMTQAGAEPGTTLHVGDQPEDTEASRAAGVVPLGAAWGIPDAAALEASKPDVVFKSVEQCKSFLLKKIG
jgi:HAD superfamily hydrolase (TIGR01509 family)